MHKSGARKTLETFAAADPLVFIMRLLLAVLTLAACLCAQAPNYPAIGIVNGASWNSSLAPNTIASIFGTQLSWNTQALGPGNIASGTLPTNLGGVQVLVGGCPPGEPAPLFYVSPLQINFLVPNNLIPGPACVAVVRQGMHGPVVPITLNSAAPALFLTADGSPVATHLDWSLVTKDAPALVGEVIVLWGVGLGYVNSGAGCFDNTGTPDVGPDGELAPGPEPLCDMQDFNVMIGGAAIDHSLILYAGLAPGFAGVYQVNVQMPAQFPAKHGVQLALGSIVSAAGVTLAVQ